MCQGKVELQAGVRVRLLKNKMERIPLWEGPRAPMICVVKLYAPEGPATSTCGVPQDTRMGPLCFLLINDALMDAPAVR